MTVLQYPFRFIVRTHFPLIWAYSSSLGVGYVFLIGSFFLFISLHPLPLFCLLCVWDPDAHFRFLCLHRPTIHYKYHILRSLFAFVVKCFIGVSLF
ncbi:hypothetical protein BC829DRAFT_60435 [Chytridium lagenaria]|nr:hypothetical protein BC829DRAFT_60435 [Chytridium lagenaria]